MQRLLSMSLLTFLLALGAAPMTACGGCVGDGDGDGEGDGEGEGEGEGECLAPEEGPRCAGDDPVTDCMTICAYLGACAQSDAFCSGIPCGQGVFAERACQMKCADMAGVIAGALCSRDDCASVIATVNMVDEQFAEQCDAEPPM